GRLDPQAITDAVAEAQPHIRDADELHDLLMTRILLPIDIGQSHEPSSATDQPPVKLPPSLLFSAEQIQEKEPLFHELESRRRAVQVTWSVDNRIRTGWVATENWRGIQALFPDAKATRKVTLPKSLEREFDPTELLTSLLRGWMETCGCVTAIQLSE